MRKWITMLLVTAMLVTMAGCGNKTDDSTPAASDALDKKTVCLVVYAGAAEEGDYNRLIWQGINSCSDVVMASHNDANDDQSFEERLAEVTKEGYDLIWGSESSAADALLQAAEADPAGAYALLDTHLEQVPDNMVAVSYRGWEGSFLAGYAAAAISETGKVGMLGGNNEEVINQFEYGYMAGVDYAAKMLGKATEIYVIYAGTYQDAQMGYELSNIMYNDNCDVIYQAAGITGEGAVQAAVEQGKYVIGSDVDHSVQAPENILLTVTKGLESSVADVTRRFAQGEFPGGEHLQYGLKENGIDIALTDHLPTELQETLQALKGQIIDGDIQVPNNRKDYESFKAAL